MIYYSGATLIDGRGGAAIPNAGLLIDGNKIIQVGKQEEITVPKEAVVIHVDGKTILPGLIDCHVHCTKDPAKDPQDTPEQKNDVRLTARAIQNLRTQLYAGVTYCRDLGSKNSIALRIKEAIAEGLIPKSPDILASGTCLTMTGGHGMAMGIEVDGVDQCVKAVRSLLKDGADFIKVIVSGGAGVRPKHAQLNFREITAIVEEAHGAGVKVAAHASCRQGVMNAALAGVDSIEHAVEIDEEIMQIVVEKGLYITPTFSPTCNPYSQLIISGTAPETYERISKAVALHKQEFALARRMGAKLLMGSDSGVRGVPHASAPKEIYYMVEAGMSTIEAIETATYGGACFLGINKTHGSLEEGKAADFIICNENPLDNIATLQNLYSVVKRGMKVF